MLENYQLKMLTLLAEYDNNNNNSYDNNNNNEDNTTATTTTMSVKPSLPCETEIDFSFGARGK